MFSLSAFISYVFVTTFTPGPNNVMAMTNGNNFGYKKAFHFILGVTAGFAVIMLLSSYLNLLLVNFIPRIKLFMDMLGVAYMLYLAIKILKSSSHPDNNQNESLNTFMAGMTMQFVNPKVILYGITVTSSFILPYYNSTASLFLFALFLAFVGFLATSCWALFGALFQKLLSKYKKPFNIFMALLLIYSALSVPELKHLLGF
ncbi:MAG: lysine transporter LysE [Clostridiales bacterium GWB2_37_7]|nr:MAG: lysine transporter LysE [Clostridiales bacterium GWB2_37_7]